MERTGWIVIFSVSVVTVVALGLGLGLGLGLNSKNDVDQVDQDYFDNVQDDERINCYPEDGENAKEECQRRGCFWKEVTEPDAPQCFHPPSHGYDLVSNPEDTTVGWTAQLSLKKRPGRYERDINNLNVDVEMQTDSRLRFKIYAGDDRYEVPISVDTPTTKTSNPMYDVTYGKDPAFGLKITRKSTGTVIFDSRLPGFTFDDQFLQISTRLPSANIYGFGEHIHESFRHDLNWKTWGIFTRDTLPLEERNLYGHHPFYICVEDDGKAHGVFIMNSNAMDVTLLPAPILTYRIVGGVLDFYIFMGPTPENVVQQYLTLVGKPVMPPYWALGFHLSKWDYGNLTVMRDVVEDMRANNMPHDVQYADIDYMDEQRSFTVDPVNYAGLGDFIDEIHSYGQKFIIILDHSIAKMDGYEPYTRGHELDVFVKYNSSTNEELIGRMWPPGDNVFPDFMDESAVNWWTEQCVKFHNTSLDFDALWVDMNEPSNMIEGSIRGCGDDRWNNPPYLPIKKLYKAPGLSGTIYEETLCMDADHHGMSHYNVHSLYGYSHAKATYSALQEIFPEKRSMVLTRSNFPGTSCYAYHWLGDNKSQWKHMKWSVIVVLLLSAAIGIYHAMSGGRQRTSSEYFLANRSMSPYPVAMSILVSIVSAITYIGTPAETYLYGAAQWQSSLSRPITALVIMFVTLPVFYNLQVTSIFEYLERRFNPVVSYTGMIANVLYILVYMGIVIYAPALTLNAVTGLSIPASTLTVGLVCTFYTTIGGIKAVVWTDVFQSIIMLSGMLITIIGVTISVGGVREVWNRAEDGGRTVLFDFRVDPTVRYSLWSCVIGSTFVLVSLAGTNQLLVQRYLTCRTLTGARIAVLVGLFLFSLVDIISVTTGVVSYAYFAGCDPISNNDISKPDQIIPLVMIRLFSRYPGLTGILVSAAFSASLSSVSSGINAMTTLTGEGVFRKIWPRMEDSKFTFLTKMTSIFYGLLCIGLAFLSPLLGNILSVTLSFLGICNGPVFGMFILGTCFPWANWIGAFVGFWTGLAVGLWLQIGALIYPHERQMLPMSTDSCPSRMELNCALSPTYPLDTGDYYASTPSFFDSSTNTISTPDNRPIFAWLYHISYLYYAFATFLTTFSFGVIISLVTGPTDSSTLDGSLLSPVVFAIHRCLPKSIMNKIKLQNNPYLEAKCNGAEMRQNESHL